MIWQKKTRGSTESAESAATPRETNWLQLINDNKRLLLLAVVLLLGMCLMLWGQGNGAKAERRAAEDQQNTAQTLAAQAADPQADELEAELTELLGAIRGVGAVTVAVRYAEGAAAVYAMERQTERSSANGETQDAERVSLAQTDSGPVLVKQTSPQVQGVAVVAAGAGDAAVRERIYQAVEGLLGLSRNQVAVVEGGAALTDGAAEVS